MMQTKDYLGYKDYIQGYKEITNFLSRATIIEAYVYYFVDSESQQGVSTLALSSTLLIIVF